MGGFEKNGIFHEKMNLSTSKFFWDNFRVKAISQNILKLVTSKFMKIFEFFDFSKFHFPSKKSKKVKFSIEFYCRGYMRNKKFFLQKKFKVK